MDSKTVRYGRIGEVVVLIFPDEAGSLRFISQIETRNLLKTTGLEKLHVPPVAPTFRPRQIG